MYQLTLEQVAEHFGAGSAEVEHEDLVWPTAVSGWTIEGACDPDGGVQLKLRHRRPDGEPCQACDLGRGVADATALNIEAVPIVLNALQSSLPSRVVDCVMQKVRAA